MNTINKSRTKKSFIICVFVLSFALNSLISFATVSLSPYGDLVDSGKHLDWDYNGSNYLMEIYYAQDRWNGHKSGVVREDTVWIIEDVDIEDINESNGLAGYCSYNWAEIELNDYYLSNFSQDERIHTVMHEMGHALGLGENNGSSDNVMKQGQLTNITLSSDDEDSYDAAYNLY